MKSTLTRLHQSAMELITKKLPIGCHDYVIDDNTTIQLIVMNAYQYQIVINQLKTEVMTPGGSFELFPKAFTEIFKKNRYNRNIHKLVYDVFHLYGSSLTIPINSTLTRLYDPSYKNIRLNHYIFGPSEEIWIYFDKLQNMIGVFVVMVIMPSNRIDLGWILKRNDKKSRMISILEYEISEVKTEAKRKMFSDISCVVYGYLATDITETIQSLEKFPDPLCRLITSYLYFEILG